MGEVRKYGKHTKWTKEEEEHLRILCETKTDGGAARILKRSRSSVRCKRIRMGITSYTDQTEKINATQISELVGVDKSSITKTWVKKGFNLQLVGGYKVASEEQLVKFMKEHPQLWKASKCDYYFFCRYKWFKDRLEREKAGLEQYDRYKDFRRWTDKEISRVRMFKQKGLSHEEIAKKVGRSKQAIDHLSCKLKKEKIGYV